MSLTLLCCIYCQFPTDLTPLSSTFIANFKQIKSHWRLVRLNNFLDFDETKVLITGYIYPNFNYCRQVWVVKSFKPVKRLRIFSLDLLPKFLRNGIKP